MPDKPTPPSRPIAKLHLTPTRIAAFASSLSAGAAVGLGIWPDAQATGGATIIIPFILAVVVTLGLATGWHLLLEYAAHARKIHERALAFGFGFALFLIGAGCSGWFLCSLIAGPAALQNYQLGFVERLKTASDNVAANSSIDNGFVESLGPIATNVDASANAERMGGIATKKAGPGITYLGLKNTAGGLVSTIEVLKRKQRDRDQLLVTANDALAKAIENSANREAALFQENVGLASNEIAAAAKVDLTSNWSGLNVGLAVDPVARKIINQMDDEIESLARDASHKKRSVKVPSYQPIDTKTAVMIAPPALGWIAAIVIESLPLIFLGLLLTVWRDEETPPDEDDGDGKEQRSPVPVDPLYPRWSRPAVVNPAE